MRSKQHEYHQTVVQSEKFIHSKHHEHLIINSCTQQDTSAIQKSLNTLCDKITKHHLNQKTWYNNFEHSVNNITLV